MLKIKFGILIVFALVSFCNPAGVFATQTMYTFYPTADTFVSGTTTGSGIQLNQNYGLNTYLRIQNPTSLSNVLVKFSESDLRSTIGSRHVISANLKLYIETNFNNWGTGSYVDVHRMTSDWSETGVTWNCYPSDTNLANTSPDCPEIWDGGYFEDYVSASLLHQNSQIGWKSFDVTSDVQLFTNDTEHFGWLLRKRSPTAGGSVDYTSIQSASINKPRLEVTVDDQATCTPTIVQSITPGTVKSDGTSQTITISGKGLDRITQVLLDKSAISFTLVNAQSVTFSVSFSAVADHEISIRSNCLTEPLYDYEIVADSVQYGIEQGTATCPAMTDYSWFSAGSKLCWRDAGARIIGYTGDFPYVTSNSKWNTDTDGDGINDDSTIARDFAAASQYKSGSALTSRGDNMIRIITVGGSCNDTAGPENCKGYGADPERMPFQIIGGDYQVDHLNGDQWWLDVNWKKRLKKMIKYADQNGLAVMIELFDENNLTGGSQNDVWSRNPWHPNNNNMSCTELDNTGLSALPAFYKIFTNDEPNCLYNKEKGFVKSVVRAVKHTSLCGPNGNTRCRNVLFKVMNEARFDTRWANQTPSLTLAEFITWNQTVARWIENEGGYVVAANVKAFPISEPCSGCQNQNEYCCLQACQDGDCQNHFDVFFQDRIRFVTLGYGVWEDLICTRDNAALSFGKPVMFDDDGVGGPRDINSNVEEWAQNVSLGVTGSCGQEKGVEHYYHTGDGSDLEVFNNPPPPYKPTVCSFVDEARVDCEAWNAMADGDPTRYCRTGGTPVEVTPCVQRLTYCECKVGTCDIDTSGDCQVNYVP